MLGKKPKFSHHNRNRQRLAAVSLIALGFVLAMIAALLLIHDHSAEPQPPADALRSTNAPSSKKPPQAAVDNYSVSPDLPKYISIPAINVSKTRIIQLELMKNNEIAAPNNIFDTGWYAGSAKPDQSGAMFIYGHVSNWTANGVFYNLKQLQPGDKITITRGDNKIFTYQVNALKIYPYDKVDMSKVLAPVDVSKPGLNLMTCTGQVIKDTSEFSERLVVFTSLANS
jgi:LPXTG-site transpeptidase (sortase) family protein